VQGPRVAFVAIASVKQCGNFAALGFQPRKKVSDSGCLQRGREQQLAREANRPGYALLGHEPEQIPPCQIVIETTGRVARLKCPVEMMLKDFRGARRVANQQQIVNVAGDRAEMEPIVHDGFVAARVVTLSLRLTTGADQSAKGGGESG